MGEAAAGGGGSSGRGRQQRAREAAAGRGGSSERGRQHREGEAATLGGSERKSITAGEKKWGTGAEARWNILTARQKERNGKIGTDDGSRDRRGNQLRVACRQIRLQMTPPSSVNEPLLTASQIQYIRQINTDNAQFSGSLVFSDTAPSSGLGTCASLAAYNSLASFLAKKTTFYVSYSTISPNFSTLVGIGMVWPPLLPYGPIRRNERHVRAALDQNITFSERLVSDALKGPGKEIVSR